MRYTPQGSAVTSFSVATNRSWTTESGERQEHTEYHNIVSWNKLAELCNQLLQKGTRVYIQGRIQTRNWDDAQGVRHYKTEIVADDMIVLERGRKGGYGGNEESDEGEVEEKASSEKKEVKGKKLDKDALTGSALDKDVKDKEEQVKKEEIPF